MNSIANRRILLVDDLPSIHEDFRKILCPTAATTDLDADEALLFGKPTRTASVQFEMDSAFQGTEALEKVSASLLANRPYAMAFVDMRMPPGWDGVETAERLWQVDARHRRERTRRQFVRVGQGGLPQVACRLEAAVSGRITGEFAPGQRDLGVSTVHAKADGIVSVGRGNPLLHAGVAAKALLDILQI